MKVVEKSYSDLANSKKIAKTLDALPHYLLK